VAKFEAPDLGAGGNQVAAEMGVNPPNMPVIPPLPTVAEFTVPEIPPISNNDSGSGVVQSSTGLEGGVIPVREGETYSPPSNNGSGTVTQHQQQAEAIQQYNNRVNEFNRSAAEIAAYNATAQAYYNSVKQEVIPRITATAEAWSSQATAVAVQNEQIAQQQYNAEAAAIAQKNATTVALQQRQMAVQATKIIVQETPRAQPGTICPYLQKSTATNEGSVEAAKADWQSFERIMGSYWGTNYLPVTYPVVIKLSLTDDQRAAIRRLNLSQTEIANDVYESAVPYECRCMQPYRPGHTVRLIDNVCYGWEVDPNNPDTFNKPPNYSAPIHD
jgi:hypothetical protein